VPGGGAASYGGSHPGGGAGVTSIYDSAGPFGSAQPPAARRDAASGIDYDNDYTSSGAAALGRSIRVCCQAFCCWACGDATQTLYGMPIR
jgi:hypothetical protein